MSRAHVKRRAPRGLSLVEVLATAVVLLVGLVAASQVVVSTVTNNRRVLAQAQAQAIAERTLERLVGIGCNGVPTNPCGVLIGMDDDADEVVYWSANGEPTDQATASDGSLRRAYTVNIDVDPPFEGAERGQPAVDRPLANGQAGQLVNVRVTVLWDEPGRPRQALALQSRVSPSNPAPAPPTP
jgi:type II secretory pathway pseudopilin PulG